MKKFVMVLALAFSSVAYAGITTDNLTEFNKLTEQQKAEVAASIAEKASQNKTTIGGAIVTPTTVDELDKWASIGQKIGMGLGAAANQLGIAVNTFVSTPVGKVTAALIIWKVIGSDLIHLFGASIMFFLVLPMNVVVFKRYVFSDITEKKLKGKTFFGKEWEKTVLIHKASDGQAFSFWVTSAAIMAAGVIMLFTI